MIYITGDTHAEFKHRFNMENFPEQKEMTKDVHIPFCLLMVIMRTSTDLTDIL